MTNPSAVGWTHSRVLKVQPGGCLLSNLLSNLLACHYLLLNQNCSPTCSPLFAFKSSLLSSLLACSPLFASNFNLVLGTSIYAMPLQIFFVCMSIVFIQRICCWHKTPFKADVHVCPVGWNAEFSCCPNVSE